MTATNHYLAGVTVAVVLKNPTIVFPVAFVSHFLLDALPHFGIKVGVKNRGQIITKAAIVDSLILIMALILTINFYPRWYIVAGFVAY